MPLVITIPGREFYDEANNEFIYTKPVTLTLEHSLLSVAKWESKWHKPYLSRDKKTKEEFTDYIRCMCITPPPDPIVISSIPKSISDKIIEYIEDPMTATTFSDKGKPSREIVTSELIYYWMTAANIPFDPCQKWHLNRLLALIHVASIKNQPPKKMSKGEIMRRNSALNAARRAKHGSRG